MALKLVLKPGERAAINGAVIVNGDRRASLIVENKARVLREGDIMQPEEATTPARLIYLPIMMMYLDPSCREELQDAYEKRLLEFVGAISDQEALNQCAEIGAHVANQEYYKALCICRKLMEFEEARLAHVA
ncbi:MAG: flagellar biosynthesis repressor FlbT [Marinicaulis sp.]|nr:flagellar biosynthesis repressor FlbT [Marinicaulis sp.]NNE39394.1 flagellar biosynthesis repressor FlbT [Marinicaulis sp.]NNL87903.1 flagellar biosynthesis repressor FlbT [Marinicaulis sp.]